MMLHFDFDNNPPPFEAHNIRGWEGEWEREIDNTSRILIHSGWWWWVVPELQAVGDSSSSPPSLLNGRTDSMEELNNKLLQITGLFIT